MVRIHFTIFTMSEFNDDLTSNRIRLLSLIDSPSPGPAKEIVCGDRYSQQPSSTCLSQVSIGSGCAHRPRAASSSRQP